MVPPVYEVAERSASTLLEEVDTHDAPVKVGFFTKTTSKVTDEAAVGKTEYPSGMTTAPVLPEANLMETNGTNAEPMLELAAVIRATSRATFFS